MEKEIKVWVCGTCGVFQKTVTHSGVTVVGAFASKEALKTHWPRAKEDNIREATLRIEEDTLDLPRS